MGAAFLFYRVFMPSLNWIGKEDVGRHLKEIDTHLLHCDSELSHGDPAFDLSPGTGNLLIEGDNLLALKALLPFYGGQVKCIYIDPPYNTGNESWSYNDKVNSPQMQKWLGKVVDSEDLCRHDKWLCMMQARLHYHHELLREDGAIFISIDDNEVHHLRMLCDEIFGESNFIANIIWQKVYSARMDAKSFSNSHDHILAYAKSEKFDVKRLKQGQDERQFRLWDEKVQKSYRKRSLRKEGSNSLKVDRPSMFYAIEAPDGTEVFPLKPNGVEGRWRWAPPTYELNKDLIEWVQTIDGNWEVYVKQYKDEEASRPPETIWLAEEVGHNHEAKQEIQASDIDFPTPKPTRLIERILEIATNPGDIVLDSFAGSGTTGHAILKMNARQPEASPRRFVLVEMEPNIARPITRERIKRAIAGYGKNEALGGGFRFCHLGEKVLDPEGGLNSKASWRDLAHLLYLGKFGTALETSHLDQESGFIGKAGGVSMFLLFRDGAIAPLDNLAVKRLNNHQGPKIVYGACATVPPTLLEKAQIAFYQAPYEVVR